ncbi:uncharacterized protein LOC110984636 [Acanthaster planci]|uniref:Uncharacterized protein LOC110984636 n=1 Tax=Acanthaster planci TaxID=133434 RepID=A0A8B7ZBV2_ACAPL|nr:uncharacterized protein LOC110984636 [Acanthaster planci]
MSFNASESDFQGSETELFAIPLSVTVFVWHLLIVLVGVPGNVLIIVVFWAKPRRTSTAVFIMALAAADLFACLARFCEVVYQGVELSGSTPPLDLYRAITVVNNLSLTDAALMTALIALDRHDCVCRYRNRLLSHRRARGAVAFVCFLSVFSNIPLFVYISGNAGWSVVVFVKQVLFYSMDVLVVFVCYGMVYTAIHNHVRVGIANRLSRAEHSASSLSETPASDRRIVVQPDIASIKAKQPPAIPYVETPCCSLNTSALALGSGHVSLDRQTFGPRITPLARYLEVSTTERQDTTLGLEQSESIGGSRRRSLSNARAIRSSVRGGPPVALQRKTTRMLFLTSLIFLLTYIPYWVFVGMTLTGRPRDAAYQIMANVLHLLFLNNAVNPLIYGMANRRFRTDVRDVLRKMCGRKPTPP